MSEDLFDEEIKEQKATLADLQNLISDYRAQRTVVDGASDVLDAEKEKLKALEMKIFSILHENNQKSFKTEDGLVGYKNMSFFVMPEDSDSKLKFLEYLKQEGVYDEYVTVNSQSLNSYLKEKFAKEIELGEELKLPPGIPKPNEFKKFYFRKK